MFNLKGKMAKARQAFEMGVSYYAVHRGGTAADAFVVAKLVPPGHVWVRLVGVRQRSGDRNHVAGGYIQGGRVRNIC